MLHEEFPDLTIVYIKDTKNDKQWSKNLDEVISTHVPPTSKITLYGSRDSFISYYTGKYNTMELIQESYVSGTEDRINNSYSVSDSKDFRKGVIWATQNQYDSCFPTVDIAIVDRDRIANKGCDRLLLARKSYETKYRFVGGFVEPNNVISPNNYLEQAARRELSEETHLETSKFDYVGSFLVDDWRYKAETSKIVTTLFKTNYVFGRPTPDDDIVELKWFNLEKDSKLFDNIVDEHKPLLNEFLRSEELYDLMIQVNN